MPRLEHLLNFTLRYGYTLWYDVIFVDNTNVLDLALWAEKILKLNIFFIFLCNLKQELSYRKQIARQLRTLYPEGIYDNPVTLKSRFNSHSRSLETEPLSRSYTTYY